MLDLSSLAGLYPLAAEIVIRTRKRICGAPPGRFAVSYQADY